MSNRQKPLVVIANCPKGSGKDTVGDYLADVNRGWFHLGSFKQKLIAIALLVANVEQSEWDERYTKMKEIPWDKLGGLSQRQFLIKISEEWIKPVFGTQYFGKDLATTLERKTQNEYLGSGDVFFITDGGFPDEVLPLMNSDILGDVHILQWTRKGAGWGNDSRDWITAFPEVTHRLLDNDSDNGIESYAEFVDDYIEKIQGGLAKNED